MPIYYPDLLDECSEPLRFSYDESDVMLYALGVGLGADPLDEEELSFVYEPSLKVVPTAVTVLSRNAARAPLRSNKPGHRQTSLDFAMVVHGEQKVELHRPLPPAGSFTSTIRTISAVDKGTGKGAVIQYETVWIDDAGEKVATLTSSRFARGDGGFGGPSSGGSEPHIVPERAADATLAFSTRPDQALLYRLNGDRNPLHCDPATARKAGFERPILHGLCTYGITCRAMLQGITGYDPDRIASHQARFSSPVLPGDTILVDLWQDGDVISFEARAQERGVTVIRNGKTVLRGI